MPRLGLTILAIGVIGWAGCLVIAVFSHNPEIMWKGYAVFILLAMIALFVGIFEIEGGRE